MIQPQVILVPITTVTNTQVSSSRINTSRAIFQSRSTNNGKIRLGFSTLTSAPPEPPSFAAPTSPLSDTTANTILLMPGEQFTYPPAGSWREERGERIDLQRFYVQGDNVADTLEVIWETRVDL